jgi:ABC-type polysaccharide/polyol phosphate transport system ATPase subunit
MSLIQFEGVSKSFSRSGHRQLLRQRMLNLFKKSHKDRFWALRNVSFTIHEGENVAVVGANGAGKSTLLSLVAGLSFPDEGRVRVDGRVAALLELGSGFHGDLTGRENIHLNASLLGLSRRRTLEVLDQVVDFSGLADFIDEPIRTYSSGMVVRLAFSIAVNVEPNFLIIDEVLAVGDRAFQAKCHDKIRDLRAQGKTLLCVSHATTTIQELCERALWLDHGELMMDGSVRDVVAAYEGRAAFPQRSI